MDDTAGLSSTDDGGSRNRLLHATAEVLARNGQTKLSMSDVAAQAGVSRPTLYRWFPSKADLLGAFADYERQMFDEGIAAATAGLRGQERLDGALRFIVDYQHSYSGVRVIDVEPEVAISQLSKAIPLMRSQLEKLIVGANSSVKASAAIRIAFSHYIVRSDDDAEFLAQLRHVVGIRT